MRLLPGCILLLLLTACCPKVAQVPNTEEAQAREAEALVRASLTDRLVDDTITYYRGQASSILAENGLPRQEAEARVMEIMQPLIETEHQRLVEALAPIFQRYYTADEIHQLLSFYQTEVAKKSRTISGQIAAEGQQYVRQWSEHFGEEFLTQFQGDAGGEDKQEK